MIHLILTKFGHLFQRYICYIVLFLLASLAVVVFATQLFTVHVTAEPLEDDVPVAACEPEIVLPIRTKASEDTSEEFDAAVDAMLKAQYDFYSEADAHITGGGHVNSSSSVIVLPSSEDAPISSYFELDCYEDIYDVNIWHNYAVPAEFFYDTLPESMYEIIPGICMLERDYDISSIYLACVAMVEVGRVPCFAGENNWFNWTVDACSYQSFDTTYDCMMYTGKRYHQAFFDAEWYDAFGVSQSMFAKFGITTTPEELTIREINCMYAKDTDGSINWNWSSVLGELMYDMNESYIEWIRSSEVN